MDSNDNSNDSNNNAVSHLECLSVLVLSYNDVSTLIVA
jgi:hypothetical protein